MCQFRLIENSRRRLAHARTVCSPARRRHLFRPYLAWALRAAGHDVLVATAANGVDAAVSAGLPAVDTAPGLDERAIFGQGQGTGADLARDSATVARRSPAPTVETPTLSFRCSRGSATRWPTRRYG